MLFKSGSAVINTNAEKVLAKIAGIINDQKDLDVLVEGHTDNVPVTTECISDNWDLSTKRATAVVRVLQNRYKVDPSRMTAGEDLNMHLKLKIRTWKEKHLIAELRLSFCQSLISFLN
ncbi:MAG: OmpA family protein [Saprospiraceae bacterium]|nr:OmpA family protein [Saprospiraceae bacterium]